MDTLSEETWIYLNILAQFVCRRRFPSKISFAREVGKAHAAIARVEAEKAGSSDALPDERAFDALTHDASEKVNAFLTKGTLTHMPAVRKAFDQVLRQQFAGLSTIDGFDLARIYDHLLLNEGIQNDKLCQSFFDQPGRAPDLLSQLASRLSRLQVDGDTVQSAPAKLKNAIGKIFNIAAIEFDDMGYPIAPYDERLDDRHFLLVRRSSQNEDDLITHGLKFARHHRNRDFMYFSEQYNANRDGERHERAGRESRGVCFFDARYVKAIARPGNGHTLTYLVGMLPVDDDFDIFPALLTTSNSAGVRIAAKSLAIAVPDADFKHRHTGIFSDAEIMAVFDGPRQRALTDWLTGEGKISPFTL
ncbi:MAG: hypothetical protein AAFW83_06175 [Pseudomonadota bacterium]